VQTVQTVVEVQVSQLAEQDEQIPLLLKVPLGQAM
jgi:hypothetical protein